MDEDDDIYWAQLQDPNDIPDTATITSHLNERDDDLDVDTHASSTNTMDVDRDPMDLIHNTFDPMNPVFKTSPLHYNKSRHGIQYLALDEDDEQELE